MDQLQITQADYILFHKNLGREILLDTNLKCYNISIVMNQLIRFYKKLFGTPNL